MIKPLNTILKPVTGLFIVVTVLCLIFSNQLDSYNIDHKVLLFANFILFVLVLITALLHVRALRNSNPYAFVRSITVGVFLKLIVIAAAVLIYFYTSKENISIYAVALAMVIYIFYTILEVKGAISMNRNRNVKS